MDFFGESKRKYKVGDKVTLSGSGFTNHIIKITSKKGANAMNKHQPKSLKDFESFTQKKGKKKGGISWM